MTYPQGQQPYPQQPLQPYGQQYPVQYPPPYGRQYPPQQYQQLPVPYPQQAPHNRPGPQYVRQQTGHSVTKHVLIGLLSCGFSLPFTIYYAASPNHYFHA